jgi:hypothetical protein
MAVDVAAAVVVVDAEEPVEAVTTVTARPALRRFQCLLLGL